MSAPTVGLSNCACFFIKLKNKKAAPNTTHAAKTGKKASAENSKSTAWRSVIAGTNTLTIKLLSVIGAFSGSTLPPLSITPINRQASSNMIFDMFGF